MQLRKVINNFQDVEYNFQLIDRLLKGQGLDGDYIREVPALKISGRLEAHQVTIGNESLFAEGYDPEAVAYQASRRIEELKGTLGDMAFEDQVEIAKLGATIVSGGYLQTIKINAASITAGTIDAARIAAGTIDADKIKARAIETDKIAVGGVTSTNLGNGSVIDIKIAAGAISANHIAAGAVTAAKIAAGAINANNLAANLILSGTIWAGYNRVRLSPSGIDVFGQSLNFYYSSNVGSIYASNASTLSIHANIISLTANSYARAYEFRASRLRSNVGDLGYVGFSNAKYYAGYFQNLPGCPTPTSNSGIGVMKRINQPLVRDGQHGRRHYFLDEDFPSEMKCRTVAINDEGDLVETEEEEIEYIRTIGVLVQSVRELIDKVEYLEKEVEKLGSGSGRSESSE